MRQTGDDDSLWIPELQPRYIDIDIFYQLCVVPRDPGRTILYSILNTSLKVLPARLNWFRSRQIDGTMLWWNKAKLSPPKRDVRRLERAGRSRKDPGRNLHGITGYTCNKIRTLHDQAHSSPECSVNKRPLELYLDFWASAIILLSSIAPKKKSTEAPDAHGRNNLQLFFSGGAGAAGP